MGNNELNMAEKRKLANLVRGFSGECMLSDDADLMLKLAAILRPVIKTKTPPA